MKIVIDITKGHFETLKEMGDCGLGYYNEAILKGQPLSEILDKISAEIKENMSWEMYDEYGNETALCKELVEIIEKYKKGDSE